MSVCVWYISEGVHIEICYKCLVINAALIVEEPRLQEHLCFY